MAEVKQYVVPLLYPKQLEFCQSKCKFTLFGGSRGGGKSFVVRHKAIQLALRYDGINILIVRRTFPELEQNHLKEFRTLLYGIAKYNTQRREFLFPNGSLIKFGYCNTDADMDTYQGQNYEVIFMDEATHFTEYMYMKFTECMRLSGNVDIKHNLKPRMYLTANPGGVGHLWVKRLFIDREYHGAEKSENYAYIPSTVYDNDFLMENNPEYVHQLEALPEKERQAMLYGDWNVFKGQFFEEFDEAIHTYDSSEFIMPQNARVYRARDYGLDMTDCLWAFLDENDCMWVYRELAQPNLTVSQSGKLINDMTSKFEVPYLDICPPDMWNRNNVTGRNAIDILMRECNQYPTKANNDREVGWLLLKERLQIDPVTNQPKLKISKSCTNLIKSLKLIQHDEKKVNDCAKNPHELTHAPDALRYLCTSYTFVPDRISQVKQQIPFAFARCALEIGEYEKVDTYEDEEYIDMGWL